MNSIKRQLTRGLFGGLVILILLSGLVGYLVLRQILVGEFDAVNSAVAESLRTSIDQHFDGQVEFDPPPDLLNRFEPAAAEYYQLWIERRGVWERSPSLGEADLERRSGPLGQPAVWDTPLPDGGLGRAWGVSFEPPLEMDEESEAIATGSPQPVTVVLVYARSRQSLDNVLAALAGVFGACGLLLPIGSALLAQLVIRKSFAPLRQISAEILAVQPGTLGHRFSEQDVPEELRATTRRLNELLERLQLAFEREKRFSSNAAHELRTPIAELRTIAEVALRNQNVEGEIRHSFNDVLEISLQMERIVFALKALSRAGGGEMQLKIESLDLALFMARAWEPFQERIREKGLDFKLESLSPAPTRTDRALLGAVLSNLFQNAVEYALQGGKVRCALEKEGDHYRLTISNTTRGLVQEDLAHLCEPFWQKDGARSNPERSGLGLATASVFARLLKIELETSLPQADLFEVALTIPMQEASRTANDLSQMKENTSCGEEARDVKATRSESIGTRWTR